LHKTIKANICSLCKHPGVPAEATILHADADSFFASVEQRDDPQLRGRPVIVGGGVVLAASYEAKEYGVRTAMGGRRARRLCPRAIVVPPRMAAYTEASKALYALFEDTTPLVEGLSIDEAFLDVRGMQRIAGTPLEIAVCLRRAARERLGLPLTVGIARTKHLAKIASAVAKPDGLLLVPPDRELAFLHPLPIERIWGIGPATAARLHRQGIASVGRLAQIPEPELRTIVGRAAARHLYALANNHDPRPVRQRPRRRSIGSQHALGRRRTSPAAIETDLVAIVDRVTRRLRAARRVGRTIVLRLRFDDYTRATRSHTLPHPTAQTRAVLAAARALLASAQPLIEQRGLTLIGLTIANLDNDLPLQLCLPLEPDDSDLLDAALDEIRTRYGPTAVTRGILLGHRPALDMPLLPD
jgi:DNA polymerase-4